jgi:hypothetical protein
MMRYIATTLYEQGRWDLNPKTSGDISRDFPFFMPVLQKDKA